MSRAWASGFLELGVFRGGLDASEIACYTYDAFGKASLPIEAEPGEWGERTDEVELLYDALAALLSGGVLEQAGLQAPENLEELFDEMLPGVLALELPDLTPLCEIYEFCGYSEPQIEENLQNMSALIISSRAVVRLRGPHRHHRHVPPRPPAAQLLRQRRQLDGGGRGLRRWAGGCAASPR